MSQPANSLPDRLARQIAGRCLYGACRAPAVDGDYCTEHDAKVKGWRRDGAKRKRKKLRKAGKCRDCRQPSKRIRCAACRKLHRAGQKERRFRSRGVAEETRGVDQDASSAVIARPETDGYERERYRGGRGGGANGRGAPNAQQINADIVRDAGYAKDEIEKFVRSFLIATSPEVLALSPLQRKEAKRLAAGHAAYASRFLDDIVDRLK